jgi:hypothetical protein
MLPCSRCLEVSQRCVRGGCFLRWVLARIGIRICCKSKLSLYGSLYVCLSDIMCGEVPQALNESEYIILRHIQTPSGRTYKHIKAEQQDPLQTKQCAAGGQNNKEHTVQTSKQ